MAFTHVVLLLFIAAAAADTDAANGESGDEGVCDEVAEADVKDDDDYYDTVGVTGDIGIAGFIGAGVSPNIGSWPYGEAECDDVEDAACPTDVIGEKPGCVANGNAGQDGLIMVGIRDELVRPLY